MNKFEFLERWMLRLPDEDRVQFEQDVDGLVDEAATDGIREAGETQG